MLALLVSGAVAIVAMLYAGRPASLRRGISTLMALWAASPYVVAYLALSSLDPLGKAGAAAVLSLSIGPVLIFGAKAWFGIDTRYNPIFVAAPFLQVACFIPFALLAHRKKEPLASSPRRRAGR